MIKEQRDLKPKVLFNASVVLSGLRSQQGGSAKVISFIKSGLITGLISEIILDEITRHAERLGLHSQYVAKKSLAIFGLKNIKKAPKKTDIEKFSKVVKDPGDRHVLATAKEYEVDYLVTLDQRHLLVLNGKINKINILRPEDLIRIFDKKEK